MNCSNSQVGIRGNLWKRSSLLAFALLLCGLFSTSSRAQIFTNDGATVQTTHGAIVQINGSMLNSSGYYNNAGSTTITTDCTNNGTVSDSGTIKVGGDWINNATFTRFIGTVIMNGGNQNFAGTAVTTFYNLDIQGGFIKTFNQSENVDDTMDFTSGVCNTSQTHVLTFTTNGNWINASSSSYVNGPCAKNFNSTNEFRYPIGKLGRVNTAGVQPTSSTATTFRCEYFDNAFTNTTSLDTPLKVVSSVQYWNVDQISGSANAKVRLYWISGDYNLPGYISDLNKLVVAMWDDSAWTDTGRTSVTGNYIAGNIQSHTITGWGHSPNQHCTLGSDSTDNGLPVELDHFAARQIGNQVQLEWLTRSEIQNLGFEIERSVAGSAPAVIDTWQTDPALQAKSEYGADYQTSDSPMKDGAYKYDLYQRDENGARWHIASETLLYRAVPENGAVTLDVFPNPASGNSAQLRIGLQSAAQTLAIQVFDITGKSVYSDNLSAMTAGFHEYPLEGLSKLASGSYKIIVSSDGFKTSKSLILSR